MLLDPGFNLTLRPMRYPHFYEMYKNAIKNTWTVEEVDFSTDVIGSANKMTPAERHMINRLVAFFATGDSIVSNNLVLNLYKHINAPEARMYLSRQLYEEALHVQFYLTLLDTYIPDHAEREAAFSAVENIPSIRKKAEFCLKWIDSINALDHLNTKDDRRQFFAQSDLLCRLHRRAVFLRGVRLRLFSTFERTAARSGVGDELGLSRRIVSHEFCVRRCKTGAEGGDGPF